jgi:fucose permease
MKNNKYLFAFIALTSLFFLWGFLTVLVDSLIPRLKEVFTLNYFQAGFKLAMLLLLTLLQLYLFLCKKRKKLIYYYFSYY